MRSLASTLLLSAILGILAFGSVFFWKKHQIDKHHAHLTAFEWFCEEFDVTEPQKEKIESLHLAYFPECEDHCIHYADTKQTFAHIIKDPELDDDPVHAEASRKRTELDKEAAKKLIDFVYSVAAEMNEDASQEYLQRMKGWLNKSSKLAEK